MSATPGPWKIASNGRNAATFRIWRNDGDHSGNAGYDVIAPHVHGLSNARMVAHSPTMARLLAKALFVNPSDALAAANILEDLK